ncbi:MAG: hypothetical protein DWG80_01305 [Chloroflexi bacterium]|nr:hypothetical protein [Chloroflexota bacterium]
MIVESLSALGAISVRASIGVYLVASEASLPSFGRAKQRPAWWARDTEEAAVVGGVPWRLAAGDEDVRVEAFCALCEGALDGIDPSLPEDAPPSPRCPRCDVRYPLTEGMLLSEVIARARRDLTAPEDREEDAAPADLVGAGRFARR